MRSEITNNQLLAIEMDIQQQSASSPAFYFFNKEKIKRFYQQNQLLLKILNEKMNGFVKQYVVHEDDKPKTEQKDGNDVYVFASAKDEEAYKTATQEFLNRVVKVEL